MGPFPLRTGKPAENGVKRFEESEGMEDTKRMKSARSIRQGSYGPTETKVTIIGPECICSRSSADYGFHLNVFMGLLKGEVSASFTLLPAFGILFLLVGCLVQRRNDSFCLALF